jgi:tetratricopeptide (TPR) repeat protein
MTVTPDIAALLRAALIHHAQNQTAEAEALYRRILELEPHHARALGMLAMIAADRSDGEAEALLLRHLGLEPDNGASLHRLGRLRARQGDDEAAEALLRQAAVALPRLAPIHNDLGACLHRLGRTAEALEALDRAVAIDPTYAVAHANRGMILAALHMHEAAADAQFTALRVLDPDAAEDRAVIVNSLARAARKANRLAQAEAALREELAAGRQDADTVEQLALIFEWSGRPEQALALRNALARLTGLTRTGQGASATVLVLAGVGGGLVPTRYLVDPAVFTILSLTLLSADQPDAPLGAVESEAPTCADVVFSALADVDHDGGQFDAATAFCVKLGKPVINPPASIAATGRANAPALFAGVPDVIVPAVRYATFEEVADLAITAPILARPAGDHGGDNLILLRNETDKATFMASRPPARLLLTDFHDFRSPDGHWRKYRLIFVDRQVYPYHLAIGDDWLLHYWRAEMQRSPWKMAEEAAFLQDWRGVFGARAAQAAEDVARRLDLDYGGMDCALMADGRLLLFEANGCFLLHLDEPSDAFAYKHRSTPPIRDAFTRMVLERAGIKRSGNNDPAALP